MTRTRARRRTRTTSTTLAATAAADTILNKMSFSAISSGRNCNFHRTRLKHRLREVECGSLESSLRRGQEQAQQTINKMSNESAKRHFNSSYCASLSNCPRSPPFSSPIIPIRSNTCLVFVVFFAIAAAASSSSMKMQVESTGSGINSDKHLLEESGRANARLAPTSILSPSLLMMVVSTNGKIDNNQERQLELAAKQYNSTLDEQLAQQQQQQQQHNKRRGRRKRWMPVASAAVQSELVARRQQQQQQQASNKSLASQSQNQSKQQLQRRPRRPIVSAMLRGQVKLKCNLQSSSADSDDEVSLILWYKDNSMVPIYSVDARAASIEEARHKPGAWLEGRSSLEIIEAGPDEADPPELEQARQLTTTMRRRRRKRSRTEASRQQPGTSGARLFAPNDAGIQMKRTLQDNSSDHRQQARSLLSENLARLGSIWFANKIDLGQALDANGDDQKEENDDADDQDQGQDLDSGNSGQLPSAEARIQERAAAGSGGDGKRLVAQLRIDSLSSEDNGIYKCRVDFRRARSRIDETELRIIVPAEKPLIRDLSAVGTPSQPLAVHSSLVGPHNEGARVILECETSGGYPEPSLTWWRNGQLVDDSYEIVSASDGLVLDRRGGDAHQRVGPSLDESPLALSSFAPSSASSSASSHLADHVLNQAQSGEAAPEAALQQQQQQQQPIGGASASGPGSVSSASPLSSSSLFGVPGGGDTNDANERAKESSSTELDQQQQQSLRTGNSNRLIRNRLELLNGLTRDDLLANYSCQAWNSRLGEPPTSYVMIDMNLRPLKVQIDSERAPVLANKQTDVVCRAFGSRPAALISWYLGKTRLIPSSAATTTTSTDRNRPTSDSGGSSSGNGSRTGTGTGSGSKRGVKEHQRQQVQISESISSDSNVTSSVLSFVPQIEHSGQLLTCRAENGFIIGSSSSESSGGSGGGGGGSSLASYTSGDFNLNSNNNNNNNAIETQSASLEDSWKLEVHYLPRVKLSLGDKLIGRSVQVGHDVYFECTVQAQPVAHELRWWFDGKELEANVSSGIIISNQSLVLQRVGRLQRGQYTCSAINSVGESHSNTVYLRIQHAPYCRDKTIAGAAGAANHFQDGSDSDSIGDESSSSSSSNSTTFRARHAAGAAAMQVRYKTHYGAARLETVRVHCHVEADPSDSLVYKWAFVAKSTGTGSGSGTEGSGSDSGATATSIGSSGKPEWFGQQVVYLDSSLSEPASGASYDDHDQQQQQQRRPSPDSLESVLNYTPKSELDYGTLLCWAQNSLGQQVDPCVYQVVPAERPEPVRNCRLLNATFAQLAVACEPGYDGGIDQTFHMEVYDSSRRELIANVTNIPGLSSELFLTNTIDSNNSGNGKQNDTEASSSSSSSINYDDEDESGLDSDESDSTGNSSSGGSGGAGAQQVDQRAQLAASLISESVGPVVNSTRQQKQRHSSQSQFRTKSAAASLSKAAPKTTTSQDINGNGDGDDGQNDDSRGQSREAIFLTEPQLVPSTDYLLSIYSLNSKGQSKPISLSVTTSNQTSGSNLLGYYASSSGGAMWPLTMFGRDGATRLNGQSGQAAAAAASGTSALMNDVFSLSWSPFLLVCTVTVLIFVLFASVTFALIKYVDLAAVLLPTNGSSNSNSNNKNDNDAEDDDDCNGNGNALSSCESTNRTRVKAKRNSLNSSASNQATQSGSQKTASQYTPPPPATCSIVATDKRQNDQHDSLEDDAPPLTDVYSHLSQSHTSGQQQQQQQQRARVVAIGNWPANYSTSKTSELEIPLNGISCAARNDRSASLLNGSFLKSKLQQLTSGQQQQQHQFASFNYNNNSSKLKQSNSDNYLNQTSGATETQLSCLSTNCPLLNASSGQQQALIGAHNKQQSQQGITLQAMRQLQQQQHQQHDTNWALHYRVPAGNFQAAHYAGGTLPRAFPVLASASANSTSTNQQQQPHHLEGPYGYLKVINSANQAHHHQASMNCRQQQQQQHQLSNLLLGSNSASLMAGGHYELLAAAAATAGAAQANNSGCSSPGGGGGGGGAGCTRNQSSPSAASGVASQQVVSNHLSSGPGPGASAGAASPSLTIPASSGVGVGNGPIEHLLISGKQYIYQTRANNHVPNNVELQHRHLQMTSLPGGQQQQQFNYILGAESCATSGSNHEMQQQQQQRVPIPQAVQYLDGIQYLTSSDDGLSGTGNNRTSDLGDDLGDHDDDNGDHDDDEDNDDDDEEQEFNGLAERLRGRHPGGGGGCGRANCATGQQQQQQQLCSNSNHFVDSDGMSSQDTQRSSTTNNTAASCGAATSTLATNSASPSSGIGGELADTNNYEYNLAPPPPLSLSSSSMLQQQQQQQQGIEYVPIEQALSECSNDGLQEQQQQPQQALEGGMHKQMIQYSALKPATKKSAGLRHTKKSLTFDTNGLPEVRNNQFGEQNSEQYDNSLDNDGLQIGHQFYIMQPASQPANPGQNASNLVRSANKARVRLINNNNNNSSSSKNYNEKY